MSTDSNSTPNMQPTGGRKLNRAQKRAKAKKYKKLQKDNGQIKQALDITHSIAKMVASGAMETDFDEYALHINVELFWNKPEIHRRNFARHMLTYFNMNNGLSGPKAHDSIEIFNIDTGTLLATYSNHIGLHYPES